MPGEEVTEWNPTAYMDDLRRRVTLTQPAVDEFSSKVWPSLCRRVDREPKIRGMKGQFGGVDLLTFVLAGRMMITFQRGDAESVTLMGFEGEPGHSCGLHTMDTDIETAIGLIQSVVAQWPHDVAEQDRLFVADADVRIAGL